MGLSENTVPFSGWSWFPLLKWAFGRSTPIFKDAKHIQTCHIVGLDPYAQPIHPLKMLKLDDFTAQLLVIYVMHRRRTEGFSAMKTGAGPRKKSSWKFSGLFFARLSPDRKSCFIWLTCRGFRTTIFEFVPRANHVDGADAIPQGGGTDVGVDVGSTTSLYVYIL